jgi:hypothetical protein
MEHGDDGTDREIRVLESAARFVEHIAERELDAFEAGKESLAIRARERSQEPVRTRIGGDGAAHPA